MDTLKALRDHGLDAQQVCPLGCPVAGGACAILLTAEDHQWSALGLIGHRGVIDRHLAAIGAFGVAAFDAIEHLVLDADVGEGAAHHHLVVATARAVGVELTDGHLTFDQVLARGRCILERPGGRDVVGRDHIAKDGEDFGPFDIGDDTWLFAHALEVGRILHISRSSGPIVGLALRHLDALPFVVAFKDVGIFRHEGFAGDRFLHQFGDLCLRGPDILEEDVVAVFVLTQRLGRDVDVHVTGQRVGDDERRGGQVVGAHVR